MSLKFKHKKANYERIEEDENWHIAHGEVGEGRRVDQTRFGDC